MLFPLLVLFVVNILCVNFFRLQLQVLTDDATRLIATYPGGNAEHVASQQAVVADNWDILQEKSAQRKSDLQATMDLFWFMAAVRHSCDSCDILVILVSKVSGSITTAPSGLVCRNCTL